MKCPKCKNDSLQYVTISNSYYYVDDDGKVSERESEFVNLNWLECKDCGHEINEFDFDGEYINIR